MQYAEIQKELKLRPAIGVYGNQIANGAQHLQEKVNTICLIKQFIYRTRTIISCSRFEATLVYKPRILSLKNEEFPFLVHKLSVI